LKYLNKFLEKYHFLISFIFFPILYLIGWTIISLLVYPIPLLSEEKSLYGTIITFLTFLICLPYWSKYKWGKNLSSILGVINFKDKKLISLILFEFLKAFIIILCICLLALVGGYATFGFKINSSIFFNSIFLGLIVGFAEELVFRVWLFEELQIFFKRNYANFLQAIIFSLVHFRWDFNFLSNTQLLIGLFLLGLYLNKWRRNKYPSILIPICFHSSIVSLWFLVNNAFLNIQTNIPNIFFGPGKGNDINPMGGLFGIVVIFMLYLSRNYNFKHIKE